ncbi:hypothetical protein BH09PAT2_BH09PAT2_08860 [soil metagenome]
MIALYAIILFILTVYSYALIDPNLTLVSNKFWVMFRDPLVYFGYYQRLNSLYVYLVLLFVLYVFHLAFLRLYKKYNPVALSYFICAILLLSYPFLSHDFFNYIFDAKILTFYGQNPYLHKALDYPADEWIRFMQWTHRSYPYGPVFLVLTLIPSYLGMGKFILNYIFFKAFFVSFYILGVYSLSKINKRSAIEFATHPLVLIEGLVSAHNDLIAVSLALYGFYYLSKNQEVKGRALFILSIFIKFTTLPMPLLMLYKKKWINILLFAVQLGLLLYLCFFREIQEWYFLTLFAYVPLYKNIIAKSNIFLLGLLLSYYPYIYLGGWDSSEKMWWKHLIIIVFALLNGVYLLIVHYKDIPWHVSTAKNNS